MYVILTLIILFHIASSLIILILSGLNLLHIRFNAVMFVVLVPVFGPICALLFEFHKKEGGKEVDLQVQRARIESEIYRSLGFETEDDKDVVSLEEAMILNKSGTRRSLMMDLVKENVVPLEEALSISTTQVRRKLMMDVLNSDTTAFYELLEEARLNDDVEVVHYATTAMSELNKQYDAMLQHYSQAHQKEPENLMVLKDYCDCINRYLNLKMVRGQMLENRRKEYISLLKELIISEPVPENFLSLAKQQMDGKDFVAANETLLEIEDRWPKNEDGLLLRIEYYVRLGDGENVKKVINNALYGQIYFDTKTREKLSFWVKR